MSLSNFVSKVSKMSKSFKIGHISIGILQINIHCTSISDGSCGMMGYRSEGSRARGSLYLVTRDSAPYCGKLLLVLGFTSSQINEGCI